MMFEYVVTASASAIAAPPRIAMSPAVSARAGRMVRASAEPGMPATAARPAPATRPLRRNPRRSVLPVVASDILEPPLAQSLGLQRRLVRGYVSAHSPVTPSRFAVANQ